MRFAEPTLLILLLAVVGLAVFFWRAHRRRRARLRAFISEDLAQRLTPSVSTPRRIVKDVVVLIALGLIAVAIARPQWGFRWERFERQGIELVVVLDTSLSMQARDAFPSRLDRAKLELTELLRELDGDQIALVTFAGVPFVQCPMTTDHRVAELFLRAVSTDLIPVKGTAIGAAVRQALALYESKREGGKAMLLITDGEDHGSDPIGAAEAAQQAGVKVFTIGVGSDVPVTIPVDPEGEQFKRSDGGTLVLTSLDEATLTEMAKITGGAYVRSTTGDLNARALLGQIRAATTPLAVRGARMQHWEERYQAFAVVAFLLLVAEALFDERRGRRPWSPWRPDETDEGRERAPEDAS